MNLSTRPLNSAEVARLYRVNPKTVNRWANEGKLTFFRTLGGHRRYPVAQFADIMAQRIAEGAR